jgi:hypothetical protein
MPMKVLCGFLLAMAVMLLGERPAGQSQSELLRHTNLSLAC